jgi:hypothetical protein
VVRCYLHLLGQVTVNYQWGSLTGFSIPCQLLCCCWHQSGHGPDGCQWNGLLRPFQMIHGFGSEPPPCGTLSCVCPCDVGLNLALDSTDSDVDTPEPSSPDIQGQHRMAACVRPCDLCLNLALDTDVDTPEPSPDMQGQHRMASRRSPRTRAQHQ